MTLSVEGHAEHARFLSSGTILGFGLARSCPYEFLQDLVGGRNQLLDFVHEGFGRDGEQANIETAVLL